MYAIGGNEVAAEVSGVNTYLDTMALFRSKFDWKSHWDESKIIIRQIDDYV